jgi:hypothetical protein
MSNDLRDVYGAMRRLLYFVLAANVIFGRSPFPVRRGVKYYKCYLSAFQKDGVKILGISMLEAPYLTPFQHNLRHELSAALDTVIRWDYVASQRIFYIKSMIS